MSEKVIVKSEKWDFFLFSSFNYSPFEENTEGCKKKAKTILL